MVKYTLSTLFIICAMPVAFAKHVPPREIIEVKIDETGKSDDSAENVKSGCLLFTITENEVKSFFLKSYPVPTNFNVHNRYSPCYAKGTIAFSDNTQGEWKISSSGGGILSWDTGDRITLFYDDYKWLDPFDGMYSSED